MSNKKAKKVESFGGDFKSPDLARLFGVQKKGREFFLCFGWLGRSP